MNESELLSSAAKGDERAFEQLAATYRRELNAHCYRMLGSPHDAEDAVQASVNSALQRARKTTQERVPPVSQQAELAALGEDGQRELIDAFVSAWERADVEALLDLLAEDARFTMPPLPAWFDGRDAVRRFFVERVFETPWRLLPIRANCQPALACYQQRLGAITVLSFRSGRITEISGFLDPVVHRQFGVPEEFPDDR